jgi:hypothetical protein
MQGILFEMIGHINYYRLLVSEGISMDLSMNDVHYQDTLCGNIASD